MKESEYQAKILKYLKSRGAYRIKVQSASRAGVPDIIACYKSKFVAIECKTPETINNVSELQTINIEEIIEAQGVAIVTYLVKDVENVLKAIDESISTPA